MKNSGMILFMVLFALALVSFACVEAITTKEAEFIPAGHGRKTTGYAQSSGMSLHKTIYPIRGTTCSFLTRNWGA